jgi:hypothetical protein
MPDRIEVVGARRLRATMKRAGIDLQELKTAHREAADIVVHNTRAPAVSGRLAATVRPGATKTMAIVRAGYASVPYAGPIHWGWPRRNIRAQPFLSEAATSSEPTWLQAYEREIDDIINRIEGA